MKMSQNRFTVCLLAILLSGFYGCKEESELEGLSPQQKVPVLAAMETGGVPVEVLFKNPELTSFKISPDGKTISYLAPFESRLNVFVRPVDSDSAMRLTAYKDRDIDYYFWKNSHTLVFLKDSEGDENYRIYSADLEGRVKELASFENVRVNIVDELDHAEDEIIISMNKNNPALFEPYRLNISSGKLTKIASNNDIKNPVTNWLADNQGKLRVAVSVEKGTETHLLYRNNEEEEFRIILSSNWKDMVAPLFFDADNKHLIAVSNLDRNRTALVRLNPEKPSDIEVLFEHDEVDVWWADRSDRTGSLGAVYYITDRKHTVYIDSIWELVAGQVAALLPGQEIYFNAIDGVDSTFIIRTYSDVSPGDFYLFSRADNQLEHLADMNPSLEEGQMSAMQPISYPARDGLEIHGYLSLPVGVKANKLPVVVMVHGGPLSRDLWGYKPDVQLLTSRGYAVLQVNYRGSWGYGKEFAQSGFREWGQAMQNDITDGVNWLIDQDIADPKRIGIYGASYGGYAALAGLTYTPELYSCGVSYVGPSNLFTLLENLPAYWEPEKEMMYEMIGHPERDSALLRMISPAFHSENIRSPLFIAQGANDVRVTQIEAEQMVNALEANQVEVVYMLKDNEGHGFRLEENRLEFYRVLCGFLQEYLQPDQKNIKP